MLAGVRAAACVVTATVLLSTAALPPAGADTVPTSTTTTTTTADTAAPTTTSPTTTTPTTTPDTTPATTTATTTTPPTTAPATTGTPATTTAPVATTPVPAATTTAPATTTTTTPSQSQLTGLIQDLGNSVAHAQAVQAYLAAQAAAAARMQAGPGEIGVTGTGTADPVLIQVAIAQLKATAVRADAQRQFDQARHRIAQVAVALYLGEQLPDVTNPTSGTAAARSAFLGSVLQEEQRQLHLANDALAIADAIFQKSKLEADNLVNARAELLYASTVHTTGGPPTSASALSGLQPIAAQRGPALSAGVVGASPSILGQSVLTADEILGWYTDTGRQAHLTVPIAELVADYQRVGMADGVRWDIAIAQAVVETGYFDFPSSGQVATTDNNFAGIGACDTCGHGFQFADAATGVAAHLQLLHTYATTMPISGPLTKTTPVAGCCPTWLALTGVWATATSYGYAILNTYRAMVVWALARRSAAAGL